MFLNWLGKQRNRRSALLRRDTGRPQAYRLQVECLEARCLLTLTATPVTISAVEGALNNAILVATVTDSVEDIRTGGLANGKPAVLVIIFRQPGANIIDTVDRVLELLPLFRASFPPTPDRMAFAPHVDQRRA